MGLLDLNKKKYKYYTIIIISFLIFSLFNVGLIVFNFLNNKTFYGANDMEFHFKRVMELTQSIKKCSFLPMFSFNYFHGSAVMSMYPYLSIYPMSLLVLITHSLIISYYIFIIFISFCIMIISFISSIKYSKSILISYIFAIVYGTSSNVIYESFSNSDLGALTSLVFLPLVIFGFIDIVNNPNNYLKFTIGIILMTFCQIPSVVITWLFICIWLLINIRKVNYLTLYSLIKSIIISFLLTSIVWLPFLHIILTNKIYSVIPHRLIGTSIKMFFEHISAFPIISIILLCFFIKSFNKLDKQMFGASIIIMFISSKLMPWRIINNLPIIRLFNVFQFSFRFLIIPQILLCYLFASVVAKIFVNKKKKLLLLLIIICTVVLQFSTQSMILNKKSHNINININNYKSTRLSNLDHKYNGYFIRNNKSMKYFLNGYYWNNDYYPRSSLHKVQYCFNNKIECSNYQLLNLRHVGYNTFKFRNFRNINCLTLPLLHYNDECLRMYVNHHLVHYYTNSNNLITLSDVKKGEHQIKIKYVPNIWLVVLKFIMFFGGILWLLLICYKKMIRRDL